MSKVEHIGGKGGQGIQMTRCDVYTAPSPKSQSLSKDEGVAAGGGWLGVRLETVAEVRCWRL